MEIQIVEVKSNELIDGVIEQAKMKDMPTKKEGWQFTWRKLFKTEGAEFYKLSLVDNSKQIQGMLMLSLMFDEMLYMNNIEVAPHNYGSQRKFDRVAGVLIAYACQKSFELGKNSYKGYLTFESKTSLISLYQEKYGATLALGQRMFIEPKTGYQLIEKYLE